MSPTLSDDEVEAICKTIRKDSIERYRFIAEHWRHFLVAPDMPVTPQAGPHPVRCGVYFQFGGGSILSYIGQSNNIPYRMLCHERAGRRFVGYGAIRVPAILLDDVESAYIEALEPPGNARYVPPEWDGSDEMVTAIRQLWEPWIRC